MQNSTHKVNQNSRGIDESKEKLAFDNLSSGKPTSLKETAPLPQKTNWKSNGGKKL